MRPGWRSPVASNKQNICYRALSASFAGSEAFPKPNRRRPIQFGIGNAPIFQTTAFVFRFMQHRRASLQDHRPGQEIRITDFHVPTKGEPVATSWR